MQREHDVAAMKQLAQSGATKFDAKGDFIIAMNAGHDERLCSGPATWTLDKAKEIKKAIKRDMFGVRESAAIVYTRQQTWMQAQLNAWTKQHHPKPEVMMTLTQSALCI